VTSSSAHRPVDPGDVQKLLSEVPHLRNMDVAEPGWQWHGRRAAQREQASVQMLGRTVVSRQCRPSRRTGDAGLILLCNIFSGPARK
jgi:hypothetical protein